MTRWLVGVFLFAAASVYNAITDVWTLWFDMLLALALGAGIGISIARHQLELRRRRYAELNRKLDAAVKKLVQDHYYWPRRN
jgi:hypothetical protein